MPENDSSVRSIERALDILNCFRPEQLEMSLTEISRELELPLSTTARIITTLEKKGFLARNENDQKYSLGSRLMRLSSCCFANMDFRRIALPFMLELRDVFNESVSLYVVQGTERVCIERVDTSHPLRRVINIGDHFPLTRGAAGRVLLSFFPVEQIRILIDKDPFTSFNELEEIRCQKYAVSRGERETGVVSIAAPIFNGHNKIIAAIANSWPSVRFKESQLPEIISKVKYTAEKISSALGY